MATVKNPLDRLRKIIGAWPETEERISHGSPTFWGGKKTFASFHVQERYGGLAVWIKSETDAQEALTEADPARFFIPPYVGPSGWIAVRLDGRVDWGVVEGLLELGYRLVAPKRAIKQLDGARQPAGS